MAKKATNKHEVFINKTRTAKCISDNIVLGHGDWDYSFILLIGGVLKLAEASLFYKERHDAAQFSAWLAEETMKRIYRFKYSKAMDDIHCYVHDFLMDHQFGKLKRWIYQRVNPHEDFAIIKSKLLGDYRE